MEEPERLRRNLQVNLETRDRQKALFNQLYSLPCKILEPGKLPILKPESPL